MAKDLRDIQDRFHRSLAKIIYEKIDDAREQLENGVPLDQYPRVTGYIRALKDVIGWAEEVELEQYGPVRKPGQEE
jgi:hypothetical protein